MSRAWRWAVVAGTALWPASAHGAEDTDTFQVTASVIDSCNVTAEDLDFGDYDPVSSTPLTASADVEIFCTNGTEYDVELNAGEGAGATIAARVMERVGGGGALTYSLFQDNTYADVWGEAGDAVAGTGSGAAQTLTIHGRAPVNQTAPAGDYEDVVTVKVIY